MNDDLISENTMYVHSVSGSLKKGDRSSFSHERTRRKTVVLSEIVCNTRGAGGRLITSAVLKFLPAALDTRRSELKTPESRARDEAF